MFGSNHPVQSVSRGYQRFSYFGRMWLYIAVTLACLLFCSTLAESAPPRRPQLGPGQNNWKRPRVTTRALTTQDLTSGLTPANLVTALLGTGVSVSNVTYTGANVAAGTFSGGTGIIGFNSGIILSSGDISFVPGPNTQDDVSGVNAGLGDPDLDLLIPGYITYDACVLEFDFQCTGTQIIQFQYVFTSEEYNEWVNSPFNDVFGFFLNGNNIALIPGSGGTPVSINNLNCDNPFNPPLGSFCNLFVNNRCADIPPGTFPCAGARDTQMDGLTVVLTATAVLNPGINHIKLAVADAGDQVLDSNVFIQGQSFTCGVPVGACCDLTTMTCTENVSQANCAGPNQVWSIGLACSQLNPPCTNVTPATGANCSDPIPVTNIPFVDVNFTDNKDNDYTNSCLGTYDNGNDIVYALTIPAAQCVDITVIGASAQDNWIGVALDSACPPGSNCIASTTASGSVASITNLSLSPGMYYLMIDRWPLADDSLSFTLLIENCGTPTGACCNTTTHVCTDNVIQANCQQVDEVWTPGATCAQLNPPCSGVTPPSGIDCNSPIPVTALPYINVNTTDKDDDYSATCLGPYDDGNDVVYRLDFATPRCIDITVTGKTIEDDLIGVALDTACPPGATCVASATTTGTVASISNLSLAAGTYYLMIDRQPLHGNSLDFTLNIKDCPSSSGACCFADGHCEQQTQAACQQAGGIAWHVNEACNPSPCPFVKGDMNCDHVVNAADVPDFIAALMGDYTGCDITLADMNFDGVQDGQDVQGFIDVVLSP